MPHSLFDTVALALREGRTDKVDEVVRYARSGGSHSSGEQASGSRARSRSLRHRAGHVTPNAAPPDAAPPDAAPPAAALPDAAPPAAVSPDAPRRRLGWRRRRRVLAALPGLVAPLLIVAIGTVTLVEELTYYRSLPPALRALRLVDGDTLSADRELWLGAAIVAMGLIVLAAPFLVAAAAATVAPALHGGRGRGAGPPGSPGRPGAAGSRSRRGWELGRVRRARRRLHKRHREMDPTGVPAQRRADLGCLLGGHRRRRRHAGRADRHRGFQRGRPRVVRRLV